MSLVNYLGGEFDAILEWGGGGGGGGIWRSCLEFLVK